MNGIKATRMARKESPKTAVIVLSMYANVAYVAEAMKAGASGYVLKGSGLEDLAAAIREVMAGQTYLSPPLSQDILNEYMKKLDQPPKAGRASSND